MPFQKKKPFQKIILLNVGVLTYLLLHSSYYISNDCIFLYFSIYVMAENLQRYFTPIFQLLDIMTLIYLDDLNKFSCKDLYWAYLTSIFYIINDFDKHERKIKKTVWTLLWNFNLKQFIIMWNKPNLFPSPRATHGVLSNIYKFNSH
jgi:hypothetical protein